MERFFVTVNDLNEFVLCVYNKQINLLIFYILFYCFTYRIFSKFSTKYIKYNTYTLKIDKIFSYWYLFIDQCSQ